MMNRSLQYMDFQFSVLMGGDALSTTRTNRNNQCSIGEHQKQNKIIRIRKTIQDEDDSFMSTFFPMILHAKCANCMVHV